MALEVRLNPPQLNSRLPAFYGTELVIPFNLNRSVGFNQFDSMVAIIKTVSTNSQKASLSTGTLESYLNKTIQDGFKHGNEISKEVIKALQYACIDTDQFFKKKIGTENIYIFKENTEAAFYQAVADMSKVEWGKIWYDNSTRSYRVSFKFQTNFVNGFNYFDTQIGQYYKIQLACVASGPDSRIGYYSSAGVSKYSAKPTLYIQNLNEDNNIGNKNIYEYVGVYLQEHDQSEKVYSYEFNLYDEFDNIVATSGKQIHNNSTDIDLDSSLDEWRVTKNLIINKPYYIQYKVITMNGLGEMVPCESPKYKIMELNIALPDISAQLSAQLNEVEGYISLSLVGDRKPNDTWLRSGSFILLRSSSRNNYDSWEQLTEFALSLYDPHTDKLLYQDYVVEQGVNYIYAIQAYNKQGYMSGKLTNCEGPIHCDFEDAFLYDGERQLKIRFNPSITNFKPTILENKVDTIGSKYPFIFRNGIVNYKEFSISGLLSLLGDENEQFLNDLIDIDSHLRIESPGKIKDIAPVDSLHLLTGDNYYKERQFKLKAAEWLSNGQPKLFKSPAEGNYIVRLMGVSLSPEETLGRMLHTFNCEACEIAEYNFENLDKYNLIPGYSDISDLKYYTIDLNNVHIEFQPANEENSNRILQLPQSYEATIIGNPGVKFTYQLINDNITYSARIGLNGIFEFPKEKLESFPLIYIKLDDIYDSWGSNATLLIGYRDPRIKTFSYIYDVTAVEKKISLPLDFDDSDYEEMDDYTIVLPPFYDGNVEPPSPPEEEVPPEGEIPDDGEGEEVPEKPKKYYWMKDLLKWLEDLRKKTGIFNFIKISTRNIFELIYNAAGNISGFKDVNGEIHNFTGNNFDIFDLNALYKTNFGQYYDGFDLVKHNNFNKIYEQITNEFVLDDQIFNIKDYSDNIKTFIDIPSLWNFKIGNGLKLEVIYQEKDISYSIENENSEFYNEIVVNAKNAWEEAISLGLSEDKIQELYEKYLNELEVALAAIQTKVGVDDVIYVM